MHRSSIIANIKSVNERQSQQNHHSSFWTDKTAFKIRFQTNTPSKVWQHFHYFFGKPASVCYVTGKNISNEPTRYTSKKHTYIYELVLYFSLKYQQNLNL